MFFQIANNGITFRIEKRIGKLINQISIPLEEIVEKRLCIAGNQFGKVFGRGDHVKTIITQEELDDICKDGAIPIFVWFFPFMGKGWMAINYFKDGKDKSVAIPVNFVALGVEI